MLSELFLHSLFTQRKIPGAESYNIFELRGKALGDKKATGRCAKLCAEGAPSAGSLVAATCAAESPAAEPLVRNGARLGGRCVHHRDTVSPHTLSELFPLFFPHRRRALTRPGAPFQTFNREREEGGKEEDGGGEKREREREKYILGNLLQIVPVF